MTRLVVLGLLGIVAVAAGCSFEPQGCASDNDCPSGSACYRPAGTGTPICLTEDDALAPGDDAELPDAGQDTSVEPIPWPDMDAAETDHGALECPTVSDCGSAEPNDTEDDAIYLSRFALGCASFDLEAWSAIHQDSLCAGDVDQFIIEYVACDNGAFKITASLTTPETCTAGGDLKIAEGLYDCQDRNVRCEVVDGSERITVIIYEQPDPQPVEQIRFAVSPGLATSGVTYILRTTIGR